MNEQEEKKESRIPGRGKKLAVVIIWAVVLILLAGVLGYGLYQWKIRPGKRYRSYEAVARTERKDGPDTRYCQYGDRLLKYNRDGISVIDGKGTILWSASYNMQNPAVSTAGDYVAAADIGSRQLYVYDAKGSVTELEILSDILQISVSEQGEVAVLMQGTGQNEIQILDPYAADTKKKVEIRTYVEEDGYALAIALSKDGAKLATSYFRTEGSSVTSNLTFYSFTGVGQGANADRIVGIYPYENTMFASLAFLDNNTVCAWGDNRLEVFSMRQKSELMWEQEYQQQVLWTAGNEKHIALIMDSEEASLTGVLQLYSLSGELETEKKLTLACRGIDIHGDDVWAYSEEECVIIRPDNKVKYEGKLHENVQYMLAGKEADQFFLIEGQYIEEIRLKEDAEE